ncbi:MAG: PEGA domain-containing protein [Gammaproteobacteria bacterium]|nr:PEGA domain-containing protein [Gammaproteobacteria bacterium]
MTELENTIIEPSDFSRANTPVKKPLFKPSPAKILLLVLFAVLLTVAMFMFNARAVKFDFDPAETKFTILSGYPTYQLGERFLMLTGDYDIHASADGYYPLLSSVSLTEEPDQDFSFSLKKLPGIVEILAIHDGKEIQDAAVFVDQVLEGETSLIINEVEAGSRDIYITHPRYLPAQTEIDVAGKRLRQSEQVNLLPAWANISVSSMPDGAEIVIDNEQVGTTPASIEVIQGERTLQLRKPGYKVFESLLKVTAQTPQELAPVVLEKANGKINIVSNPAGVNVTISGQYLGQTPLAVALPPAENYQLVATRAGYQNYTRALSISPEEDLSLNLSLKPIVGLIKLAVTPPGASLFVDNRALGDANQTLELKARSHELRVELAGYASYVTKVIPQPGLPQQLNIVMLTEEAARVSSIPQQISTSLGDTLRFIIPGTFAMGAGRREPGRRSNEIEKNVELTRSFYLGEQEISNRSFKQFDPGHDSGLLGRALLSEEDRPVVNVSWEEAVRFSNWLSEKDGLPAAYALKDGQWHLRSPASIGYRLPTEAEWAWAARYASGKLPTRFPWGDNMPPTAGSGNYADVSAANMVPYSIKGYNDNFRGPAPSGTYASNELGIFDLAGNVSEWINDYYSVELHRKTLVDPLGPIQGDYYVIRGSNYTHGRFSELRWTFRDYGSDPRPDVGFRIARYVE